MSLTLLATAALHAAVKEHCKGFGHLMLDQGNLDLSMARTCEENYMHNEDDKKFCYIDKFCSAKHKDFNLVSSIVRQQLYGDCYANAMASGLLQNSAELRATVGSENSEEKQPRFLSCNKPDTRSSDQLLAEREDEQKFQNLVTLLRRLQGVFKDFSNNCETAKKPKEVDQPLCSDHKNVWNKYFDMCGENGGESYELLSVVHASFATDDANSSWRSSKWRDFVLDGSIAADLGFDGNKVLSILNAFRIKKISAAKIYPSMHFHGSFSVITSSPGHAMIMSKVEKRSSTTTSNDDGDTVVEVKNSYGEFSRGPLKGYLEFNVQSSGTVSDVCGHPKFKDSRIDVLHQIYKEPVATAPSLSHALLEKDAERKMEFFDSALRQDPEMHPEDVSKNFNFLRRHSGEVNGKKKKEIYQKILKINPRHADAWYELGNAGGDEAHGGKECYQKVLEIDPRHYDARNSLGLEYGSTLTEWFKDWLSRRGCI